jgi:hypothetical protein
MEKTKAGDLFVVRSTGQPQRSTTADVELRPDSSGPKAATHHRRGRRLRANIGRHQCRRYRALNGGKQLILPAENDGQARRHPRSRSAPTKASAFRQLAPHLLSYRRPASRLSKSRRRFGIRCPASLPHHHRVGHVLPLFVPRATSLCQANGNSASSSAPIAIGATRKLHDMSLTTTTSGSIPAGG